MFLAERPHAFAMTVACFLFPIGAANAADWIAAPSFYTHSPKTGERIDQFQPTPLVAAPPEDPYARGVYRHYRSSIRLPGYVDHLHVVDRSGFNVRPYGEWQYPYRPYSVPYGLWGPQLPLVVGNGWGVGGWNGGGWGNNLGPGPWAPGAPGGPGSGWNPWNPANPGPNQPGGPGFPGAGFPGTGFPGGPGLPIAPSYPVGQGWPNPPQGPFDGDAPLP